MSGPRSHSLSTGTKNARDRWGEASGGTVALAEALFEAEALWVVRGQLWEEAKTPSVSSRCDNRR